MESPVDPMSWPPSPLVFYSLSGAQRREIGPANHYPFAGIHRQLRPTKRGATPAETAPIPERLCVTAKAWLRLVRELKRLLNQCAGTPTSPRRDADQWCALGWLESPTSRAVFVRPATEWTIRDRRIPRVGCITTSIPSRCRAC
jgi:hypothetical protein